MLSIVATKPKMNIIAWIIHECLFLPSHQEKHETQRKRVCTFKCIRVAYNLKYVTYHSNVASYYTRESNYKPC